MTDHFVEPKKVLSPTAQEVLDAVLFEVNAECYAPWIAAAAIRALADQVVPEGGNFIAARIRDAILAISTELGGQ